MSDSEGEEFEIEVEFRVEFRSPFSVIFEDDDFRREWEPFLEVTEEEEKNLLALLSGEREAFSKSQKKSRMFILYYIILYLLLLYIQVCFVLSNN